MRYVGFWEYEPENIYKMFELDDKIEEEYAADKESWYRKYGKFIEAYWLGMEPKGFTIMDFDSEKQMVNLERAYWPIKKWKFVPLFTSAQVKGVYLKKKEES